MSVEGVLTARSDIGFSDSPIPGIGPLFETALHLPEGANVDTEARIFGQDDAKQVEAGQVVSLESTLRTTLRALAVCAARRADERTVRQLVERARDLAERLTDALRNLDDSGASRDARAIAAHLEERLAILERLAQGSRSPVLFS